MNSYSSRLILVGTMIGILVVSAVAIAKEGQGNRKPSGEDAVLLLPNSTAEEAMWSAAAVPAAVLSWDEDPDVGAGPFYVALRVEAAAPQNIFLCDRYGSPLAQAEPDGDGDAALGPLAPGDYSICAEGKTLGRFSLLGNAALAGAEGLLWTDGELLHLTDKPTGEAVIRLVLPKPGYYSLYLTDCFGQRWQQDLFIPKSEYPDRDGCYLRTLRFRGLPEGLYTAVYAKEPLAQFRVTHDAPAEAELCLERGG